MRSLPSRCAVRAFAHAAYALACIAIGDARGAARHGAAATAWAGVVASAKAAELAGVPGWWLDMIDAGVPLGFDGFDLEPPDDE